MANVSFGGGVDPSSTFASLNRSYLNQIEALAGRAQNRADERRSAEDADMYDKYKNGLISDEQWLAYIERRVNESVGDPKEHQAWVETQREFTNAIADDRAEQKFEAGEITAYGLLDHYQGRMEDMDPKSKAYRDMQDRVWQIEDRVAQDDLWYGAQDITDKIATGRATIGDLIKFYRNKLGGLRRNSDLYEQVRKEIRQLESQAISQGYSLGGGGGGGGGGRRSGGRRGRRGRSGGGGDGWDEGGSWERGLETMPARDGVRIATSGTIVNRNKYGQMLRDERGVSSDAKAFVGAFPGMDPGDTAELLEAYRREETSIMDQWMDSGEAILPDGTILPFSINSAVAVFESWADNSEAKARAYEANDDPDAASSVRQDIAEGAAKYMQPLLAAPANAALDRGWQAFQRDLFQPGNIGNFDAVQRVAARWAPTIERTVNQIMFKVDKGKEDQRQGPGRMPLRAGWNEEDALLERPRYLQQGAEITERSEASIQLIQALASGDPQAVMQAAGAAEILGWDAKAYEAEFVEPVRRSAAIRDGVAIKVFDPENPADPYQVVPIMGGREPGVMYQPVHMDIGGRIERVHLKFRRGVVDDNRFRRYVDFNGQTVSFDPDDPEEAEAFRARVRQGVVTEAPGLEGWVAVGPDGVKYYYSQHLGPNGGIFSDPNHVLRPPSDPHGTAYLEEVERFAANANVYATGVDGYIGTNLRGFRRMVNEGAVTPSNLWVIDGSGNIRTNSRGRPLEATFREEGRSRGGRWDISPEEEIRQQQAFTRNMDEGRFQRRFDEENPGRSEQNRGFDPFGAIGDFFGGGGRSMGGSWDDNLKQTASAIGVRFGQSRGAPKPMDPAKAAVARTEARLAEQERRLAKFELPGVRNPVVRKTTNAAPRIQLPTPKPYRVPSDPKPRAVIPTPAPVRRTVPTTTVRRRAPAPTPVYRPPTTTVRRRTTPTSPTIR